MHMQSLLLSCSSFIEFGPKTWVARSGPAQGFLDLSLHNFSVALVLWDSKRSKVRPGCAHACTWPNLLNMALIRMRGAHGLLGLIQVCSRVYWVWSKRDRVQNLAPDANWYASCDWPTIVFFFLMNHRQ